MIRALSDMELSKLSEFIELNLALHFPENRWDDLERNITTASKELGYTHVRTFIKNLTSTTLTRSYAELLASHLTVNETYFWREPLAFEALENIILPELLKSRYFSSKKIRIWSAGCSGGEEPYSIAIALSRVIPDIAHWDITILATDISPTMLEKAVSGVYGKWSFRGTPQWLKENYFKEIEKNKFEIIPKIKSLVNFRYLNLAENEYPSPINNTNAMDIIYCRNVLMYFKQSRFQHIAKGLHNSLVDGGYLIVSSSELSSQNFPDFVPVNFPGLVLYQKTSSEIKSSPEVIKSKVPPVLNFIEDKSPIIRTSKKTTPKTNKEASQNKDLSKNKLADLTSIATEYLSGEYELVISKLRDIEKTPEQHTLLIRSYANLGQPNEALESCEMAISKDKIDPSLHFLYATILQNQNRITDAIAAIKRALFIDSEFILAYYTMGNLLTKTGNLLGANKNYTNAISILDKLDDEEKIPESEGMTAGRLKEIIKGSLKTHTIS
jgi:chemotaxis protein methyltransferase CheR